jgi:hypothetical protein
LSAILSQVDAFMQDIMEKTIYPRMELNLKLGLNGASKWLNTLGLKRRAVLALK